jgi:hypothetical protein
VTAVVRGGSSNADWHAAPFAEQMKLMSEMLRANAPSVRRRALRIHRALGHIIIMWYCVGRHAESSKPFQFTVPLSFCWLNDDDSKRELD